MSCYTRHLGDWLPPEPTWADRRALDAAVRAELGLEDADCPEVWAAVKEMRAAQGRLPATQFAPQATSGGGHDRPQVGRVADGGPPPARSEVSTGGGGGVNSPRSPLSDRVPRSAGSPAGAGDP